MKQCAKIWLTALVFLQGVNLSLLAAGANPTGTWKVSAVTTNTQTPSTASAQTLKLKLNGSTLTGTLTYNSSPVINGKVQKSELPITEPKIEGDTIAFTFSHPPSNGKGPNAIYKYQGRINGDAIKGTFTTTWMDQTRTREWQAERVKE
jgi:hypothetical protein